MKKKLLACLTVIMSLSLTSCDAIFDWLNGGSNKYSYRSADESYRPAAATSLPPNSIEPQKGLYDYKDFVNNNVYEISSTPCEGNANILVIPLWFKDSGNYFIMDTWKEYVRRDIETAYFGTNEQTGWRSVKTYYEEESHGALEISGTVSDWYYVDSSYQSYAQDEGAVKTAALVKKATDWYFEKNPSDSRTHYDRDKDGYLDGVMVIYAAPDQRALNREDYSNLWAYCYWMQDKNAKNVNNPGANAFFWASYDFMYGSNTVYSRTNMSKYASGDTFHCTVDTHTYIHEMGHLFGLEDYYDYSSNEYDPAGTFSMQDRNVGGHDAFSSFALGWGKAYVPSTSITINLKPFAESGEMILLSPNNTGTARSPFDEYLLLEYYTPTGLNKFDIDHTYRGVSINAGANGSGIRVWHVDARLLYFSNSNPNVYSLTNNPTKANGKVALAMSNTYNDGEEETQGYLSPLGAAYYDYNILQMIRNDTSVTYRPAERNGLLNKNLFKAGESFTMSKFAKQFVNSGKLNDRSDLGFKFEVKSVYENFAEIAITKL